MQNNSPLFQLEDDIIYVNHAAVAPWPQATVAAVRQFAAENGHVGSRHYGHWSAKENALKQALAQLINAPSDDDIALLKSTSEGLSVIAYGIDWQPGDNIVIAAEEFPSNRIVWESLRPRGVEVREARLFAGDDPEQALIGLMDDNTRLLSVSAVQYASGLRMDLARLSAACKQHDSLFCVDAIQHIGALQFDVQAIAADFVVADGHKWMLGPEGLALFYCRRELIDTLQLHQFGWHMVEAMGHFDDPQWQPAGNARRFECGSPNMLGIHALQASIQVLLEQGMAQVEQQLLERSGLLIDALNQMQNVDIITDCRDERRSGIVTFNKAGQDMETMYHALVERGVVCALRGGGIRLSPHFYTDTDKLHRLLTWIDAF